MTNAAFLGIDFATTRSARLPIRHRQPNGLEPVALKYLTVCNKLPHRQYPSVARTDKEICLVRQSVTWKLWLTYPAIITDRVAIFLLTIRANPSLSPRPLMQFVKQYSDGTGSHVRKLA